MKKALKITAAGLVIFALVTNLYSAIFSYYGIKTNNLEGVIWANSLATTDGSSSSTSTNVTSTSNIFHAAINTSIECGEIRYSGSTSNIVSGSASFSTNATSGVISVSFSSNGGVAYTGTIPPHRATMVECVAPTYDIFCTNKPAISACSGN